MVAEVARVFMSEMAWVRHARAMAMAEVSVIWLLQLFAQGDDEESESEILEDGEEDFS